MHYDEDDDEYSDLDLDFEDAVERGYEDDKDFDDSRNKPLFGNAFKSRSTGGGGSGSPAGCLLILGVLGASFTSAVGAWFFGS
ncbi:MAG: hypothetical protein HOI23_20940 [Deltaproteobacteria bacterium]|jgi:hypothetical protein|nr:hypothetical protein [Deltaproteobacteria bacterium]MBT6433007.1 hypothetical protein [Deltaproteobacteria bacterium]MBT6490644.1 hypothetical protein [Deltaproteobacteria bacterium]